MMIAPALLFSASAVAPAQAQAGAVSKEDSSRRLTLAFAAARAESDANGGTFAAPAALCASRRLRHASGGCRAAAGERASARMCGGRGSDRESGGSSSTQEGSAGKSRARAETQPRRMDAPPTRGERERRRRARSLLCTMYQQYTPAHRGLLLLFGPAVAQPPVAAAANAPRLLSPTVSLTNPGGALAVCCSRGSSQQRRQWLFPSSAATRLMSLARRPPLISSAAVSFLAVSCLRKMEDATAQEPPALLSRPKLLLLATSPAGAPWFVSRLTAARPPEREFSPR
jgi:hypothetical protein